MQSCRSERAKCKAPEPVNWALAREVAATALRRDSNSLSTYGAVTPEHSGSGSFTQSTFSRLDTSYFVQSSTHDTEVVFPHQMPI
ncbi:hypothetical protein [Membranihabitans marinus]|uniref:hypothetical protein n=1 Tax=Membranihabitans marinus TaxID=1227546 RepID=UPI001F1F456A|nr:hypothetical protein [Membranihabitans marinus]